jgi:multiple sugar transport system substrate-binding protein
MIPVPAGLSALSRILVAGAVTAMAALVLNPLAARAEVTEIVFASGPDDTGTVQRILDGFNEAHKGQIRVRWRQMARENDAHRRELLQALTETGGIDLIASDVIWTAELASLQLVEDLTTRFYETYQRDAFVAPVLDSAAYRLRIWGVPWYTDGGMLFYRRDKLARSGFSEPPATWQELERMAIKVMEDTGTRYGLVFQGAAYEGGAANAAEFIWSAGGEVMTGQVTVTGLVVNAVIETDAIAVGSEAAARGLDIARGLVASGVVPPAVTGFREQQSLAAFVAGEAVFLRSWPYVDGVLRQAGFTPEQFGVAPLPAAAEGGRHASCLGGWNLMINAESGARKQQAAWTLIEYLTDPARQKQQALQAGLLPVLEASYDDPDLISRVPVIALGKQIFTSQLHARPMSPFYNEISASLASAFNRTLKGELTGTQAAALLEKEIRAIAVRNR